MTAAAATAAKTTLTAATAAAAKANDDDDDDGGGESDSDGDGDNDGGGGGGGSGSGGGVGSGDDDDDDDDNGDDDDGDDDSLARNDRIDRGRRCPPARGLVDAQRSSAVREGKRTSTDAPTYAPSSSVEDGGTTLFDCCVVVDWDQAARLLLSAWSQNCCV